MPERQLWDWRFDDPAWITKPTSNALVAQNIAIAESWSGYALDMSGQQSSLLLLPVLSANRPNVAPNAGTIRFWFSPYWKSSSTGGAGPGDWARLLEIGSPNVPESFWITLAVDPTGNILTLAGNATGQPPFYMQAATLQWQPGTWHELAMVYSPSNTLLVVDGSLAVAAENHLPWPPAMQWPQLAFSFGSGLEGQDTARGQLDQLTTFAFPLSLEYLAWHYQQLAPAAALGPITEEEIAMRQMLRESTMMTSSSPPEPPGGGGGGGGSGGGVTNAPSPPGLKLTKPIIFGSALATTLAEADTNNAYDIFQKLGLQPTNTWTRVAMGDIGQTNFSLAVPSTNHAFYMAAAVVDSDFDGLPDSYEELVLHTSPLLADSDGDGIPDGFEDLNGNNLPDYVDYNGLTRAIVYTTASTAYEGGQAGEVTIRLPSSAPTNNTKVTLDLGGLADYDGDYWLAKLDGTRVTNDLFFVIGEREIRLQVHASNDTVQASTPRKVSISLAESANFQLDPNRADVTLIDNDLPTISVIASDTKAAEPSGTNVNPAAFLIRRDGMTTNALTVLFGISGTATGGSDFTNFTSPVVIPAGSNFVTIPVNPIHDTNYEGDENVILTLQTAASYTIDSSSPTGMVTIAENDLPLVYFVGTDLVATEYNSLKAAIVTVRRTGNTSQPLTVPFAISGTATNGVDYQTLTNFATFAANASNTVINVRPLSDSIEEPAETVTLVIKGSISYNIGSSNAVTVFIDDSFPTRYEKVQLKQSAVYDTNNGANSPSVCEIRRFGRSFEATNFPFRVFTNGITPTTFYRVTGDVSGTNAVLAPFATKARLNFSAPGPVGSFAGGVDVLTLTHLNQEVWSVFYQPTWQALKVSVIETNVVEGGTVQGRVRVSRNVTAPVAMTVGIAVTGQARPAGYTFADHTLPDFFYLTIASNSTFAETTFTAPVDGFFEGWESIMFVPSQSNIEIVFDYDARVMGFVRESVTNPELLPTGDYDADGLPDRWELAHGFDPFTRGEEGLDPDKDGVITIDEYGFNTNPNSDDSDGDGVKDFPDVTRPFDPGADFLEIRLQTRDTGKVNNGQNCAVCHTTQLKVGNVSHFSKERNVFSENTVFFRKGTNYPFFLSEVVQNLSAATANTGTPTTTATYGANILPATNQPRAFIVSDPQAKLGTNKSWSNFPADSSVSVGTLTVPKIEVTWEAAVGNTALDTNSNAGGGVRMFPDALSPTVSGFRNTVIVNVKTIPALPGQTIRLKSFDVDDPSSDTGGIIDTNDYFGRPSGNDNRGTPKTGQLSQTTLTLDSQGKAFAVLTVPAQPGDNVRVAAVLDTPGAQAHLDSLQVATEAGDPYVSPDTNAVPDFVGGISPMLTIWRKLHLEFDSMTAPPTSGAEANFVSGTITHVTTNSPAGRSKISIGHTQPWVNGFGQFAAGKLEISGVGAFAIINGGTFTSGLNNRSSTGLEIIGVPAGNLIGLSAKIYDDDERYLTNDFPLYESLVNLPSPPLSANGRGGEFVNAMQFRFSPAYIQLVDVHPLGWNPNTNIAFQLYAPAVKLTGGSAFDAGNLDLKGKDKPEFWCFSVCFGYQPGVREDGDGPQEEIPLLGGSPYIRLTGEPYGYSVIFLESIRDNEFGVGRPKADPAPADFKIPQSAAFLRGLYANWLYGVIAHELGHGPGREGEGDDHDEGDLMQTGGNAIHVDAFHPLTIRRFRSVASWTR
jgi:hypothetical protein